MNDFVIEHMPNKTDDDEFGLMIREKSTGWFYPNLSKTMAKFLCNKLNEVSNSKK